MRVRQVKYLNVDNEPDTQIFSELVNETINALEKKGNEIIVVQYATTDVWMDTGTEKRWFGATYNIGDYFTEYSALISYKRKWQNEKRKSTQ